MSCTKIKLLSCFLNLLYVNFSFDCTSTKFTFCLGTICDFISQVITERLTQSHAHKDGVSFSPTLTIAEETSQMAIDDNSTDCRSSECSSLSTEGKTDCLALNCCSGGVFGMESPIIYQTKQLKYLVHSYNRSLNEEKNHPKVHKA